MSHKCDKKECHLYDDFFEDNCGRDGMSNCVGIVNFRRLPQLQPVMVALTKSGSVIVQADNYATEISAEHAKDTASAILAVLAERDQK